MVGKHHTTQQGGFALLIALIVVTVVISVGLAMLDVTVKQVRLGATTEDSEIAFHAANAGAECARYVRRTASSSIDAGDNFSATCFGATSAANRQPLAESGEDVAFHYEYRFTWGNAGAERCSDIDMISLNVPPEGSDTTVAENVITGIVGRYAGSGDYTCTAGSRCTIISVRGYNQECNAISGIGVVERRVLLEL